MKNALNKYKNIVINNSKIIYVIIILLFALPSIIYQIDKKTIFRLNNLVENSFFLNGNYSIFPASCYLVLVILLFCFYFIILKNRDKLFKNEKDVFINILFISIIFLLVTPFLASDIVYYLGIGRLNSTYHQNPYYVTMYDFMSKNDTSSILKDKVLMGGWCNYWSDTTVVYGPIWTIICAAIAKMSFGSIDLGVYLFKIVNLIAHLFNCYLLYKLSNNKKIFPLIYGINPFILIEGLANVHNDIIFLLFVLIALYLLLKKKKLLFSLFFLSLATNIKFLTIIFLPYFIIYHFREEKVLRRFFECLKYGVLFATMFIIPYLLYIEDLSIFTCMLVQRDRFARGIYYFIMETTHSVELINIIKNSFLIIFALVYIIKCFKLLFKKEIIWDNEMKDIFHFLLFFIFLLLTNFQAWYLTWFFMVFIWQTSTDMRLIIDIQFSSIIAYTAFIKGSSNNQCDIYFLIIMIVVILIGILLDYYRRSKRLLKDKVWVRKQTNE